MAWTAFIDQETGGLQKTNWKEIYIELSAGPAEDAFCKLFGRDPIAQSCECCGDDFRTHTKETLQALERWVRPSCVWRTNEEIEEDSDTLVVDIEEVYRLGLVEAPKAERSRVVTLFEEG